MKLKLDKFYDLVDSFHSLPSIGKKVAQRLAYYIVLDNTQLGIKLSHSIENAISFISKCQKCGCMSQSNICEICLDDTRHKELLCIVQNANDIFQIEDSKQFYGKYFVMTKLHKDLINDLIQYVNINQVKEIIFAISPSLSNDAFMLLIEDRLKSFDLKFTKIAQGIPTGVSLENIDILSLSKSIQSRTKL
jgi:recombination protein RecR